MEGQERDRTQAARLSSLLERARTAYEGGNLDGSAALAQEVLGLDQANLDALWLLRLSLRGHPNKEAEVLSRILAIEPDHVEALNAQAGLHLRDRRFDDAMRLSRRALELRPGYAGAHVALGTCYRATGQLAAAAEQFERALLSEPGHLGASLDLALVLQEMNRIPEARRAYERAATTAPDRPEVHQALGLFLLRQRQFPEAAECFRRALATGPSSSGHVLLAMALRQGGETADSIAECRRALAIDPNSAPAHRLLGLGLLDQGHFTEAAASFEHSISLEPLQAEAYLGLVMSRRITEEDRNLLSRIDGLLGSAPLSLEDRASLYAALGKAYDDLGEFETAIRCVDEGNRLWLGRDGLQPLAVSQANLEARVSAIIGAYPGCSPAEPMADDEPRLVLVIGMPRSGTTLVEQILSRHSQVSAGGEIRFWEAKSAQRGDSLTRLFDDPDDARRVAAQYSARLRGAGGNRRLVTDKSNDNAFYLGAIHRLFPGSRVVFCHREALDTCLSLYLTPFLRKPPMFRSREGIVFYHGQYRRLVEHWRRTLPPPSMLRVRYEKLVSDPERETRRLLAFCGLGWEDACLRHDRNDRAVNTPSRWQARQAIYTSSVGRWRNYEPWLLQLESVRDEGVEFMMEV